MIKRKASTRPALAYDVHYAVGRPARTTAGLVPVATSGTRSIREECARHASISGLRLSAYLVAAGRRIRIGMSSDELAPVRKLCSAIVIRRFVVAYLQNLIPLRVKS